MWKMEVTIIRLSGKSINIRWYLVTICKTQNYFKHSYCDTSIEKLGDSMMSSSWNHTNNQCFVSTRKPVIESMGNIHLLVIIIAIRNYWQWELTIPNISDTADSPLGESQCLNEQFSVLSWTVASFAAKAVASQTHALETVHMYWK